MIRRFNYTGRVNMANGPGSIAISLSDDGDGTPRFDAHLDLQPFKFDKDADVIVEAVMKNSFDRFSYGKIGQMAIPDDRRLKRLQLKDLENGEDVKFRVKVVDRTTSDGRLIGFWQGVPSGLGSNSDEGRVGLLDVKYRDIGYDIWTLDFTGDCPALVFNSKVPNARHLVPSNQMFHALVLPAVLREILLNIFVAGRGAGLEDPESWQSAWAGFTRELPADLPENFEGPDASDETLARIDEAVTQFSSKFRLLDGLISQIGR